MSPSEYPQDHNREADEQTPGSAFERQPEAVPLPLTHLPQEIPLDHPQSRNMFQPSEAKPFVATPAAIDAFGVETILQCLTRLQMKARLHGGLDHLQVFEHPTSGQRLWFIEDGPGGAITAMLPSDY